MHSGWEWVDQGTDEFHVYRRRRRPHFELHGYRLNRCAWLWHVMLDNEFAGKKEHGNLDDAMAEAEKLSERLQREAESDKASSPHLRPPRTPHRRSVRVH